jgi:hypothetical protein
MVSPLEGCLDVNKKAGVTSWGARLLKEGRQARRRVLACWLGTRRPLTCEKFRVLDGLQIFDEVFLFLIGQSQLKKRIVVVNHSERGSEAAIMIKAAFLV